MVFSSNLFLFGFLPLCLSGYFLLPKSLRNAFLTFASLGFYGGVGHFILIRAFRLAPASTLTPFGYTQLIWAGLLGWLVFGHIPDALSAAGMAVIAASGLWLALGERRRPDQADAAG